MAAYQIFVLFCVAVLFNTAESYKCYKCSSTTVTDACFKGGAMGTESCTILIEKCLAKQTVDIKTNATTFTRECHTNIAGLGGKDGCNTNGGIRTCQMVCDKDNCNGKSSTDLEKCAAAGNCQGETIKAGHEFQCYSCESTDSKCVNAPGSSLATAKCTKGLSKCMTQSQMSQGKLTHFKRGCHVDVFGLGAKDGCKTEGGVEKCQIVCDNKNLCNNRAQSDMEKCAREGGCNTAALSGPTMFLFVCTATVVIKLFV